MQVAGRISEDPVNCERSPCGIGDTVAAQPAKQVAPRSCFINRLIATVGDPGCRPDLAIPYLFCDAHVSLLFDAIGIVLEPAELRVFVGVVFERHATDLRLFLGAAVTLTAASLAHRYLLSEGKRR